VVFFGTILGRGAAGLSRVSAASSKCIYVQNSAFVKEELFLHTTFANSVKYKHFSKVYVSELQRSYF
jgi:hypothetical protein